MCVSCERCCRGERQFRAQSVNWFFALRALAALEMLHGRKFQCCLAIGKPDVHSGPQVIHALDDISAHGPVSRLKHSTVT